MLRRGWADLSMRVRRWRSQAAAELAQDGCGTGWAGTRSATVFWPPVTSGKTVRAAGSTRGSGPGQKAEARRQAASGTSAAQSGGWSAEARCTISG